MGLLTLGLLALLLVLRVVYLERLLHKIRDENVKLARWNRRLTDTGDVLADQLDDLLPLGNVDVLEQPSNVVPLERTRA